MMILTIRRLIPPRFVYSPIIFTFLGFWMLSCNNARQSGDFIPPLPNEENASVARQIQLLNEIQEQNEGNADFFYQRAKLNLQAERPNPARRDIDNALRLRPNESRFHYLKGRALLTSNELGEALEEAKKAESMGFKEPDLYVLLGELNYLTGKKSEALQYLQKAENLAQSRYDISFYLGRIYAERNDTTNAFKNLRTAIELNPKHNPSYTFAIQLCNQHGLYQMAMDYAKRGLEKTDTTAGFSFQLGETLEFLGQKDSAAYWYRNSLEQEDGLWEPYYKLAKYHQSQREFPVAEEKYNKALSLNPEIENGYFDLGLMYEYNLQDPEKAMSSYQQAMAMDSTNAKVNYALKRVQRKIEFQNFLEGF